MSSELVQTINEILKQSKEGNEVSDIGSMNTEVLNQLGLPNMIPFSVARSQRIDLAMLAVTRGAKIAGIVEHLTWKDFEGFVAGILSENNYKCVESFRRRGNSELHGMEIDVVGVRGRTIIAVDAKMWSVRSGKESALKMAAEKQKNRTLELSSELGRLFQKLPILTSGSFTIFPVMVTWLVEEVELHEGVPVVPVFKLNSFIHELDYYEDLVVSYTGRFNS
ncbi:MAG: hypothetical protein ACXABM_16055 [Candidatus Thorarchaeota archaeon]|jgi:hypothetical protein